MQTFARPARSGRSVEYLCTEGIRVPRGEAKPGQVCINMFELIPSSQLVYDPVRGYSGDTVLATGNETTQHRAQKKKKSRLSCTARLPSNQLFCGTMGDEENTCPGHLTGLVLVSADIINNNNSQ